MEIVDVTMAEFENARRGRGRPESDEMRRVKGLLQTVGDTGHRVGVEVDSFGMNLPYLRNYITRASQSTGIQVKTRVNKENPNMLDIFPNKAGVVAPVVAELTKAPKNRSVEVGKLLTLVPGASATFEGADAKSMKNLQVRLKRAIETHSLNANMERDGMVVTVTLLP